MHPPPRLQVRVFGQIFLPPTIPWFVRAVRGRDPFRSDGSQNPFWPESPPVCLCASCMFSGCPWSIGSGWIRHVVRARGFLLVSAHRFIPCIGVGAIHIMAACWHLLPPLTRGGVPSYDLCWTQWLWLRVLGFTGINMIGPVRHLPREQSLDMTCFACCRRAVLTTVLLRGGGSSAFTFCSHAEGGCSFPHELSPMRFPHHRLLCVCVCLYICVCVCVSVFVCARVCSRALVLPLLV